MEEFREVGVRDEGAVSGLSLRQGHRIQPREMRCEEFQGLEIWRTLRFELDWQFSRPPNPSPSLLYPLPIKPRPDGRCGEECVPPVGTNAGNHDQLLSCLTLLILRDHPQDLWR